MAEFINTIDELGDDIVLSMLIEKTITVFKDDVLTSLGTFAFKGCSALITVNLPNVTSIGNNSFHTCSNLSALILQSSTMCELKDINAFYSASIQNKKGYIYVPKALVDSYKTATRWSTYASQFRAIEDYTVDGTITGELDETKI